MRATVLGMSHDLTIRRTCTRLDAQARERGQILEERDRALAALYMEQGIGYGGTLSHRVIAEEYGLTPTTVRNAVHRYGPQIEAETATQAMAG